MQDYDIYGETPLKVLAYVQGNESRKAVNGLRLDMQRFLDAKDSLPDREFTAEYNQIFYGTINLDGYLGRTTRQWLQEFHATLARAEQVATSDAPL